MADIDINRVKDIDPIRIRELSNIDPLRIDRVRNIEPVAVHIKEVNHIDPLSIEALHVTEIRNIDPIRVEQFQVTHLPTVNMAVRQLPPVDMSVRQWPAVSVGTHQHFDVPSSYTMRARLLGFEFLRLHLSGRTAVVPRERHPQEVARSPHQSYARPATAGNPAIPTVCREVSATTCQPAHRPADTCARPVGGRALYMGHRGAHVRLAGGRPSGSTQGSTVRSGG